MLITAKPRGFQTSVLWVPACHIDGLFLCITSPHVIWQITLASLPGNSDLKDCLTYRPSQQQHFIVPTLPVRMENFISNGGKWILANINATGYYRVNYDPENWKRLMDQLESNPNVGTMRLVCKLLNSGLTQLYVDLERTMFLFAGYTTHEQRTTYWRCISPDQVLVLSQIYNDRLNLLFFLLYL